MTNAEFRNWLEQRTLRFSVQVLKSLQELPHGPAVQNIKAQVSRSATSVGANYREANRAESKSDFVHKIAIVAKEAAESEYWLLLLRELCPDVASIEMTRKEAGELVRLFDRIRAETAQLVKLPSSTSCATE